MRRVLALGVFVVVIALAVLGWRHGRGSRSGRRDGSMPQAGGSASASVGGSAAQSKTSAPKRVRRLAPEERRQLGQLVAAALARRAAANSANTTPGTAPALPPPDPVIALEDAGPDLQQALQDSVALLAECFKQLPGGGSARDATALMVMSSDPDYGTVIDTDRVTDADGAPLDPALDTCLRDTIDTLALPALAKPGKLPLQYTFKFE